MDAGNRLYYEIELDKLKFEQDARGVKETFNSIGDEAVREGERVDSSFRNMAAAAVGFFTIQKAAEFAKKMIEVRSEVESLEISFQTLLGDKQKADALFASIREFAANTPMMLGDLAKGAQTLLSFNIEAERVMPILKQIGDVSMGDSQKFNSLILSFSQMTSTGKLMGQDLLQMINAGFNPLSIIAEKTGKSIGQLKEEMSQGAISADMVAQAYADATSEGGKFNGMLEKQSKGLTGGTSNLQGALDDMFNDLGTKAQGTVSTIVQGATDIVRNYQKIGDALSVLIVGYGSYKAAVIATHLVMKATAIADNIRLVGMFRKELGLLTAAQQAFNLTALKNPYIAAAAAVIAATVAISKLVKRKREEEQAIIDSTKEMREEYTQTNLLVGKLKDANIKEDERMAILEKLREVNPDIVQAVTDESKAYEQLSAKLDEYNKKQLAAIAVKQYSKRSDFEEAAADLLSATDKMKDAEAGMMDVWSEIYGRWLDMKAKGGEIPEQVRTLMESIVDSAVPEADKVEAVFSAWRVIQDRIKASRGTYSGYSDGRLQLDNLLGGLSDKDWQKASKDLAQMEAAYGEKAQALKQKIEDMAAAIYSTDEAARKRFIEEQSALYFPDERPATPQVKEEEPAKNIAEQVAEAKKKVAELKKEIKGLRDGTITADSAGKPIKDLAVEIESKAKALKAAEEKLAILTGEKVEKKNKDTAKEQRQIESEARELRRLREDLDHEAAKAEVEAMEDGFAKKAAQRELDHKRELLMLDREKEDYLLKLQEAERTKWEAANPKWEEKGLKFTPTVTALPEDVEAKYKAIAERMSKMFANSNRAAQKEALEDYMTYEQRKQQITEKYEKERAKFYKDGKLADGVTQGSIDILNLSEKAELKALDEETSQAAQRSSKMLKTLFGSVTGATKKEIKEAIAFAEKLIGILKNGEANDLTGSEGSLLFSSDQIEAMKADEELIDNIIDNIIDKKKELYGDRGAMKQFIMGFKELGEAMSLDDAAEKSELISDGFQKIISSGSAINNIIGNIADTMKKIADLTDNDELAKTAQIVGNISDNVNASFEGAQAGYSVSGSGWGAAIGAIIGGIINLVEIYAEAEAEAEQINTDAAVARIEYQTAYNLLLIEQNELLEEADNFLQTDNIKQAMGYVSQYYQALAYIKANISELYGAEIITGGHTEGMLWWKSVGNGYAALLELYPQVLGANGDVNADILRTILNTQDMDAETKAALQGLLDYCDALDEAKTNLQEYLSETFGGLGDALMDSIVGKLETGQDALESFADSCANVVKNLGKQLAYSLYFAGAFTRLKNEIEALWMNQGLSEQEIAEQSMLLIGSFFENLDIEGAQRFLEQWYSSMEEYGMDAFGRTGTTKGVQSMSQDSADEMNGRLTVIQGHTYILAENSAIIADNIRLIANIAASILNHLEGIHDNTREMTDKLESVSSDVAALKSSVSDIAIKGIKIH